MKALWTARYVLIAFIIIWLSCLALPGIVYAFGLDGSSLAVSWAIVSYASIGMGISALACVLLQLLVVARRRKGRI